MRKLASIKKILDILPIEGKDRIVLAIIDGWQVIVRKDEYEIGDKTIFVEIDSVLPEKPEFEFLRSKKFRVRTMKMGGIIWRLLKHTLIGINNLAMLMNRLNLIDDITLFVKEKIQSNGILKNLLI